ncbi:lipoprotein [Bradyrhizobium sp. DOA1]|nr:lipoprotein [Bradyrhizobium sp. DOA1]
MDQIPYAARALSPAHADLPRSAGVPAQLANEEYVEALARIVYHWAYPAVDTFGRTNMWQMMKDGPGAMLGLLPGAPMNTTSCLSDYMSPSQRWVVTPNNDTFYGAGFANLGVEPAVIQTPTDAPQGHYWTVQIVDVFTNVVHQLGSASKTPGGKFLLVGPDWKGQKPDGYIDILRMPTNIAGVFPRSFAARTPEAKARALAVLDQIGMYPLSKNAPGQQTKDCKAVAANSVYPPGVTAQIIKEDPDASRPQWVNPKTFWDDAEKMLAANPTVGHDDMAMASQARTLIALRKSSPEYKTLLDRGALAADAALHASSTYVQVGVDAGNGWQRQEGAGLWGTDWFSRAQATVIYIYVNDSREATYFVRGTDAKGALLDGRHTYTMTFLKDALPPMDRTRGGFWSLTMYDKDYFMLPNSPNGRTNIGTVSLDANELKFGDDGSLTITLAREQPADATARANWLPAPDGQFALIVRAYVPTEAVLRGSYKLPNVEKR